MNSSPDGGKANPIKWIEFSGGTGDEPWRNPLSNFKFLTECVIHQTLTALISCGIKFLRSTGTTIRGGNNYDTSGILKYKKSCPVGGELVIHHPPAEFPYETGSGRII